MYPSGGSQGSKVAFDWDDDAYCTYDTVFNVNGQDVVIDRKSLQYLSGSTVDFRDGCFVFSYRR
jgi:Fe-S cluster assembly iron-binding protein IscA